MNQLELFTDDFLKYHHDNPEIYRAFKRYAFRAINRGYRHWGAKSVFEVIRWETGLTGNDDFKVNNNYTALYARMFMDEYPQYAGFFRTRESKFDKVEINY